MCRRESWTSTPVRETPEACASTIPPLRQIFPTYPTTFWEPATTELLVVGKFSLTQKLPNHAIVRWWKLSINRQIIDVGFANVFANVLFDEISPLIFDFFDHLLGLISDCDLQNPFARCTRTSYGATIKACNPRKWRDKVSASTKNHYLTLCRHRPESCGRALGYTEIRWRTRDFITECTKSSTAERLFHLRSGLLLSGGAWAGDSSDQLFINVFACGFSASLWRSARHFQALEQWW